MLTYIFDFNLNVTGNDAEAYLEKAVQQWPPMLEEVRGIDGCLFLANALRSPENVPIGSGSTLTRSAVFPRSTRR